MQDINERENEAGMNAFTERVITIIRSIPEGKIMTYGQIARLAGSARGARQVARILHAMSEKYQLPWHRVVNAQGRIVILDDEARFKQLLYLSGEQVEVDDAGFIALDKYLYEPLEQ